MFPSFYLAIMKDFVAYYRVSTDGQRRSGLGLAAQQEAISQFIQSRQGTLIAEFKEIESGKKKDRPALLQAIEQCKKRRAVLLIARLDRLARNVAFISSLMEASVNFIACDMPEANRLTIHILAAVAEYERELISERTKRALQEAKKKGIKLGNPKPLLVLPLAYKAMKEKADLFAEHLSPLVEKLRMQGYSYTDIAREFNARRLPTARQRNWYPTTVKNLEYRGLQLKRNNTLKSTT